MSAKPGRKGPCADCKHRAVVVAPGTVRQVGLRYRAAWDACYKCARRALAERDKLRRLIVAAAKVIGMSRPWSEQKAQIDKLRAEAARIRRAK
jgi:hypothetical protein